MLVIPGSRGAHSRQPGCRVRGDGAGVSKQAALGSQGGPRAPRSHLLEGFCPRDQEGDANCAATQKLCA